MDHKVTSLREAEEHLHSHGDTRGTTVHVTSLSSIRHATEVRRLLREQIDGMGWEVDGMAHLDPPVRVHSIISLADPILDQIIADFTATQAPVPTDVPWPDVLRLAERMAEAGTGLPHPPVHVDLIDLAGRILRSQAQPHDDDDDDSGGLELPLTTRLLDAGTNLRHVHLGSLAVEEIVHLLGELLEEVAAAIVTELHPRPRMVEHLLEAKTLTMQVWDLRVPVEEFSLL